MHEKVAKALVQARKEQPFKLAIAPKGVPNRNVRHNAVVYVLLNSDQIQLDQVGLSEKGGPQAVFVQSPSSQDTKQNLFTTYLSHLEKIEGETPQDFMKK